MNCQLCHLYKNGFHCSDCVTKTRDIKLQKLKELQEDIAEEVKRLEAIMPENTEPKELISKMSKIKFLEERAAFLKSKFNIQRERNLGLKASIERRRKLLNACIEQKSLLKPERPSIVKDLKQQLSKQKRLLVKDLVSLFKLRKVKKRDKMNVVTLEYRILTVGCPSLAALPNLHSYNIKKVNAFATFVSLMTKSLSVYLDFPLPHPIISSEGLIYVQYGVNIAGLGPNYGKRPLFLDPSNSDQFVIGLAILNYNIAYLCFMQNVIISLDKCCETLESLAMLCEAPYLGFHSRPAKGHVFHLEVEDVIDSHIQLSQRPWEVVDVGLEDELWDLIDQDIDLIAVSILPAKTSSSALSPMESRKDEQETMTPGFFELFKDGLTYFMQKAKESMDAPGDLIRFLRYPSAPVTNSSLVFLGQTYSSPNEIVFLDDFQSRIWVTYRSDFSPCKSFTSDAGWGCMLRSGQMILASGLMNHKLGRDWRIGLIDKGDWIPYAEIVTQFVDSPTAPFSIHKIALQGQQLDKEVGQWFGPATVAQVIKSLVNEMRSPPFRVYVSQDGTLYTNEILAGFKAEENTKAALILVPVMLGLDRLTPVYHTLVKKCFDMKQCVGIAGGRTNSSLFFAGYQDDNVIYYDPHFTRTAVPLRDLKSYAKTDLFSYHCDRVRYLRISSMSPSMVIGFYVKDAIDFDQFLIDVQTITKGNTPLFSVEKELTEYARSDGGLLSDEDL